MISTEEVLANARTTIELYEQQCHHCRAGHADECVTTFDPDLACSEEKRTPEEYLRALRTLEALENVIPNEKPSRKGGGAVTESTPAPPRPAYNSGYIHPDAWRFSKNIGEFADPTSTGRKLAAELYVIPVGMVCEWAKKRNCGGGVEPIVGCMGNPATDTHHGPDKNTLDNEKASWAVGGAENVHLICSSCHNRYHSLNDRHYGPYDRVADQAKPWLPIGEEPWTGHQPEDAEFDELVEEERRRFASEKKRGRKTRGRVGDGVGVASDVIVDEHEEAGPLPLRE